MDLTKPYSHPVAEWINEHGGRECLRCPRPITGAGFTLRHADESIPPRRSADPAMTRTLVSATAIGSAALESLLTDNLTDEARARAVVEALELAGALRHERLWRAARHRRLHVA